MHKNREKFSTQVDSKLLSRVRRLAKQEGRQIQALVDEAMSDLIVKHRPTKPREHVMAAYQASLERYARLCEKLAK